MKSREEFKQSIYRKYEKHIQKHNIMKKRILAVALSVCTLVVIFSVINFIGFLGGSYDYDSVPRDADVIIEQIESVQISTLTDSVDSSKTIKSREKISAITGYLQMIELSETDITDIQQIHDQNPAIKIEIEYKDARVEKILIFGRYMNKVDNGVNKWFIMSKKQAKVLIDIIRKTKSDK